VPRLDPNGQPVPGAQIEQSYGVYLESAPTASAEGKLVISGLPATPGVKCEFLITEPQRRLAAVLSVPASDDKQPILRELRLGRAAGVTGQVLDEDRKPIPQASVYVHPGTRPQPAVGSGFQWDFGSKARRTVDPDGRFCVEHAPPRSQLSPWRVSSRVNSSTVFPRADHTCDTNLTTRFDSRTKWPSNASLQRHAGERVRFPLCRSRASSIEGSFNTRG
jgi:hypothetical protein